MKTPTCTSRRARVASVTRRAVARWHSLGSKTTSSPKSNPQDPVVDGYYIFASPTSGNTGWMGFVRVDKDTSRRRLTRHPGFDVVSCT